MYTSEFNNVSAISNSRKRIKYGDTIRLKFYASVYRSYLSCEWGRYSAEFYRNQRDLVRTKAILPSEMYEEEDKFFFSGGHQDEILFVLLNQCVK